MNLVCLVLKFGIFFSVIEVNICGNIFESIFYNKGLSDLGVDLGS